MKSSVLKLEKRKREMIQKKKRKKDKEQTRQRKGAAACTPVGIKRIEKIRRFGRKKKRKEGHYLVP